MENKSVLYGCIAVCFFVTSFAMNKKMKKVTSYNKIKNIEKIKTMRGRLYRSKSMNNLLKSNKKSINFAQESIERIDNKMIELEEAGATLILLKEFKERRRKLLERKRVAKKGKWKVNDYTQQLIAFCSAASKEIVRLRQEKKR